jgi:hypothetical protein
MEKLKVFYSKGHNQAINRMRNYINVEFTFNMLNWCHQRTCYGGRYAHESN